MMKPEVLFHHSYDSKVTLLSFQWWVGTLPKLRSPAALWVARRRSQETPLSRQQSADQAEFQVLLRDLMYQWKAMRNVIYMWGFDFGWSQKQRDKDWCNVKRFISPAKVKDKAKETRKGEREQELQVSRWVQWSWSPERSQHEIL